MKTKKDIKQGIDRIINDTQKEPSNITKVKSVEKGLKPTDTRVTIILDKQILRDTKAYTWFKQSSLKQVIGEALTHYFEGKERKITLNKALKLYKKT